MDIEISAEAKNKSLNRRVALTVVVLSVVLGLSKIKDDNLVQAMQQSKADAVDTWGEYQATKTKLHVSQTALGQTILLESQAQGAGKALAADQHKSLEAAVKKYQAEAPALAQKAKGFEAQYDALNVHDDQFDLSDALLSIAISLAAVAALAESEAVIAAAWISGALGIVMVLAGFLGWKIHPDAIMRLLS